MKHACLLAFGLLLTLASCGGSEAPATDDTAPPPDATVLRVPTGIEDMEVPADNPITPEKVERIRGQMRRYGALALALPTMIPAPLPMRPMVVAAGAFRMGVVRFVAVIAAARAVRYFAIAYVAVNYGEAAVSYLNEYGAIAFVVFAALCVAVFVWKRFRAKIRPPGPIPAQLPEARGDTA